MDNSQRNQKPISLERLVSGGQTGVDRAALDAAMACGIPTGGWCPRGRRSEDGRIPTIYPLKETTARSYAVRTEWNVRDSDGTLIVVQNEISSGTRLTVSSARKQGKPYKIVHLQPDPAPALFDCPISLDDTLTDVVKWLTKHEIRTLNVAGPRGSSHDSVYTDSLQFIKQLIGQMTVDTKAGDPSTIRQNANPE